MEWFRKLLGLCTHKWTLIQTIEVYETWDGERYPGQAPTFHKRVLQCNNCGDIKVRKT